MTDTPQPSNGLWDRMLKAVAAGEQLDLTSGNEEIDDPTRGAEWPIDRQIRAEWIAALAIGKLSVHHLGIRVKGARIVGVLDLRHGTVACPIYLTDCSFEKPPELSFAELPLLSLAGSDVPGFEAYKMKVAGDVLLEGARIRGEAVLINAEIGGDLFCEDSAFIPNEKKESLTADGLSVGGDVFFRNGIFGGEMRLISARIGGDLDCDGGTFINPQADALRVEDATVEGNVYLGGLDNEQDDGDEEDEGLVKKRFRSEGAVRISGIEIRRDLSCAGGTFRNPGGQAFHADRASVKNNAFFGNRDGIHPNTHPDGEEPKGFHITGELRMIGADIGGNLDFMHAEFEAGDQHPPKIILSSTKVGQNLIWSPLRIDSQFHIYLDHADVGVFEDSDLNDWPTKPDGEVDLDGFKYRLPGDRVAADRSVVDRLGWLGLGPGFRPGPYLQLRKVYLEAGDVKNAVAVGLALEQARVETLPPLRRQLHRLWGWTTGFGYLPHRGLVWLGGVVLAAFLLATSALNNGLVLPIAPDVRATATSCGPEYPCFNPLAYVVETVIPLVDLDQRDYWRLDASGASWTAGPLVVGWLFPLLMGLGWLFTTVLLAGIATFAYRETTTP